VRLFKDNLASLQGPALANWKLEPILPALADRACTFVRSAAGDKAPFFLYLPLTSPHTPLAVNDEWKGRSGIGTYGDFVMETDHVVGRVLTALEDSGAAANTLVIFTSDNGCSPEANFEKLAKFGHDPSAIYRGHKADISEGGHRVPLVARWPGTIAPAGQTQALACLTEGVTGI
jgi:arylsulfatase A